MSKKSVAEVIANQFIKGEKEKMDFLSTRKIYPEFQVPQTSYKYTTELKFKELEKRAYLKDKFPHLMKKPKTASNEIQCKLYISYKGDDGVMHDFMRAFRTDSEMVLRYQLSNLTEEVRDDLYLHESWYRNKTVKIELITPIEPWTGVNNRNDNVVTEMDESTPIEEKIKSYFDDGLSDNQIIGLVCLGAGIAIGNAFIRWLKEV